VSSGASGNVNPHPLRVTVAFVTSEILVLVALLGPLFGAPWWQGFRAYAYPDQLTYASIATNWSLGDMRFVEPFTQTGTSHYPSLWYQTMGLLSKVTGMPVYRWWTLMGIAVVSAAVLASGWLAYRMSKRAWAPVLPGLALFTGVLAAFTTGNWIVELLNHAVLWGPLASFFTLNSEAAGVCLVVVAMVMLLLADPQNGGAYRWWLVVAAAALLGLIANIHTYAFFSGLTLALAFAAALALSRSRSRTLALTTLAFLAVSLVVGWLMAPRVGPLPVLAVVLVALVPAAVSLARGHAVTAVGVVVAFSLMAAPQVTRTLVGVAQGDPFLTYRQVSSRGLGVAVPTGLVAALPLILVGVLSIIALRGRRQHSKNALLAALAFGTALMSQNDRWGFNQEPYRFWIVFTSLAGLLMVSVLAWSLAQIRGVSLARRRALAVTAALAAAAWTLSLVDTVGFWHYASTQGIYSMEDARSIATRDLLAGRDGLIMPSACVEPQVLKVMTGARIAHYNRGLAWPVNVKELFRFQDKENRAAEDPDQLKSAGVSWVLTDSSCASEWDFRGDTRLVPFAQQTYASDRGKPTMTLWQVRAK
jgi:hypothetical protein